jgi:hypothetical protein
MQACNHGSGIHSNAEILPKYDSADSLIWHYGLYALMNIHFHHFAPIDDTTQVLVENLKIHDSFCNALKIRLNWFGPRMLAKKGMLCWIPHLHFCQFIYMDGSESQKQS